MITARTPRKDRTGGVYIAVLGTALVISLLGLAALVGQRVQNRVVTASADIRQAHMNAKTALELGLLLMKQAPAWRTTYADLEEPWFTHSTGSGTAQLFVAPANPSADETENAILFADPNTPVKLVGLGHRRQAQQRITLIVDPIREPLEVLKAAAESAKIGVPLSGQAALDWNAVFNEYLARSTPVTVPSGTKAYYFSRNPGLNSGQIHWTGNLPGGLSDYQDADNISVVSYDGHSACLKVERNDWREGAANHLNAALLKPNTDYQVSIQINVMADDGGLLASVLDILLSLLTPAEETQFRVSMIAEFQDGTTAVSPNSITPNLSGDDDGWNTVSGSLRTPNWSQHPATVYLVVNSNNSGGSHKMFCVDNLDVREIESARFIYQKALGPGVNPFGAANPNGIYSIDCNGSNLVIERSRILGTLLVLNPGPNSRIDYGPTLMSPKEPGYPALLVDGNFALRSTKRPLGELENSSAEQAIDTNYNPAGMPYDFGTSAGVTSEDSSANDIYPSEIRGLVAISGNLTYANSPRVRGPVILGGSAINAGGGTLTVEHDPQSLLNPPPGFAAPITFERRPASVHKAVLP